LAKDAIVDRHEGDVDVAGTTAAPASLRAGQGVAGSNIVPPPPGASERAPHPERKAARAAKEKAHASRMVSCFMLTFWIHRRVLKIDIIFTLLFG
jgi:hypothetical protein